MMIQTRATTALHRWQVRHYERRQLAAVLRDERGQLHARLADDQCLGARATA